MSLALMMPAEDAKPNFPKAGDYEPCGRTTDELISYIKGFVKGGLPALARLKQVLPSIFAYFKIIAMDEKADILIRCGLSPYREDNDVTFFFRATECAEPLRAPGFLTYKWEKIRESDHLSPRSKQVPALPMACPSRLALTPPMQAFERQEAAELGSPGFSTPDLEISHSAPELGRAEPSDSPSSLPVISSLPTELMRH
jgi:hypothetical protein